MAKSEDLTHQELIRMHKPNFGISTTTHILVRLWLVLLPSLWMEWYTWFFRSIGLRFYYLTTLGMSAVTVIGILGLLIALMKKSNMSMPYSLLRFYNILYGITLASQFIIVPVYWISIHPTIEEYAKTQPEGFMLYTYAIHILPFACLMVELLFSKHVIKAGDIKYLLMTAAVYLLNNFYQTKMNPGYTWYPFMTWKDSDSLVAALIIGSIQSSVYLIACLITYLLFGLKVKRE